MRCHFLVASLLTVVFTTVVQGKAAGPVAGKSNDPPDSDNCTQCHDSAALNSRNVTLTLFDAGMSMLHRYRPAGVARPLTLSVTSMEAGRIVYGFQATPLAGLNPAGTLTPGTGQKIVTGSGRQYIEHSTPGRGSATGHSWTFTWLPPATDLGDVTFYACGNAGNDSNTSSGDYIECTTFVIQPVAANDPVDDGVPSASDNCPEIENSAQSDADLDGAGDACDGCPQVADPGHADFDLDAVGDACDKCLLYPDPTQADSDSDGLSDACEFEWGDVAPRASPDGAVTVSDIVQELRFVTVLDSPTADDQKRGNVAPSVIVPGAPEMATPTLAAPLALDISDVVLMLRVAVSLTEFTTPH